MSAKKKVVESKEPAGKATVKKGITSLFAADEETDSDSDTHTAPVASKSTKSKEDLKLKEKEKQKQKEKEKAKEKAKAEAKKKPIVEDSSDESSSDEEKVPSKKKVEDDDDDDEEEEETHNETSDGEEKEEEVAAPNGDEFLINLLGQETFEKTLSTLEAMASAASQLRTILGSRVDEILTKRSRSSSSSSSDDPDAPSKKVPRVKGPKGTKALKKPKDDENTRIFLAGRRIPYDELKAKYGGEILLVDVSDRGSFKRFHMCFPHGKIPIPNTKKDLFSQTVQGIYEGSKIFEKQGKNLYSMRESDPPKIIRPETEATGPLKGYLTSLHGEELMDEKTARYKLLIEPYKWLLENTLKDEVAELKKQLNDPDAKIVIVDRKPPSIYWDDPNEPVSHGLLLREFLNGKWPSLDDDFSAFHAKKRAKKEPKAKTPAAP